MYIKIYLYFLFLLDRLPALNFADHCTQSISKTNPYLLRCLRIYRRIYLIFSGRSETFKVNFGFCGKMEFIRPVQILIK